MESPNLPPENATAKSPDERKDALAAAVAREVGSDSRVRIESQSDYQAVLVRGRRPNHVLHLILSLLTLGFWAVFVWLPLVLFGGEKRSVITVDERGNVLAPEGHPRSAAAPGPADSSGFAARWRGLPTWGKWAIGVFAALVVIGAATNGNDAKKNGSSDATSEPIGGTSDARTVPVAASALIDGNTVFNSAGAAFIKLYQDAVDRKALPVRSGVKHCDEGKSEGGNESGEVTYRCQFAIAVFAFADEGWRYSVEVTSDGCWTANTIDRHGAFQRQVDAYQDRDPLAPSKRTVKKLIDQAKQLDTLKGCIPPETGRYVGSQPEKFIATLAAGNVARTFPGRQRSTTCRFTGSEDLALTPRSYAYSCTTTMANGKKYIDRVTCFSKPPYSDFGSCGDKDGDPKNPPRPRRPLP